MRWYLTNPASEFREWSPLAMGAGIPNVSLPSLEPESEIVSEDWSLYPLTDTAPNLGPHEKIIDRVIVVQDNVAIVVYETAPKTAEEIEAEYLATIPNEVSSVQAKTALYGAGLYDAVDAALGASPYALIRIWWASAQFWKRDHPYILGIGAELGLNDDQIDDLFIAAGKVPV